MSDRLKIERIGGLAGFGLPSSKLQSQGEQTLSALSAADKASVENLFAKPTRPAAGDKMRDGFRYRITRTQNGRDQTIEVPDSVVPRAIKDCVTDKLL